MFGRRILGFLFSLEGTNKHHYYFNDFQRNTLFGLRVSDGWINITNPFRSIFIAGGAGSGKSESLIKPIILESVRQDYCGILYDFKDPELSTYLYTALLKKENSSVTFKRISFSDIASSARCNPLAPRYLHTLSHAEEYATVIINNLVPESITKMDFWSRSAVALLQSTIWYFKENRPKECDLPHIVAFLQSSHHDVIKTLMQDDTCKRLISSIVTAYEQNAEGQLAGTISTLQLALNKINTPEIAYILGRDEVNLDINNPNEPTFLAIGNDPNIQGSISPVISLIITVSLRMMNKANKYPSVVILDEAPTLYIPNFESIPATARSNKISIVFCCQDLSQVVDRYGKGKKDILLSNLAYQFWGRVSHFETSQYMIQLAGKDDVMMESYSSSSSSSFNSSSSSSSVSQSKQLRDNLKIQHIQNFAPGNFLCVLVEREPRFFDKKFKRPDPVQLKNVFVTLFRPEIIEVGRQDPFTRQSTPDVKSYIKQVYNDAENLVKLDRNQEAKMIQDVKQAEELANKKQADHLHLDGTALPISIVASGMVKGIVDNMSNEGKDFEQIEGYDKVAPPKKKEPKKGF